jgi:hypothetical protein
MFTTSLATLVRTDMPLALVIFLLGLKIWGKVRDATIWQSRDRLVIFALLTAAMLIKGPIVYAFLLPGIIGFEVWRRKREFVVSAWCGWWPWVASLAVFIFWAAIGVATVPNFYEHVVLREFAGRFDETVHRAQPLYFYLPHLLHKFAPWSILLIALAILRVRQGQLRSGWKGMSPEIAWLGCWILGALIVMSLVPSKRVDRIFPIVPPLSLLLAAQFAASAQPTTLRLRKWGAFALVVACLFTSGYVAQRAIRSYRAGEDGLAAFGAQVRTQAKANGWRYEVIGWLEEGLLLYTRRMRFVPPEEVIEKWNDNALDAVVLPVEQVPRMLAELPGSVRAPVEGSIVNNGATRRYTLVTRQGP